MRIILVVVVVVVAVIVAAVVVVVVVFVVVVVVRLAYVIYEDNAAMCTAFDKLSSESLTLEGKQLRLMKYDPTVEWPTGNYNSHYYYKVK